MQGFLSQADALTVPLHNSPLYRFGISLNKLFDYMLAEKPILQASNCSNDLIADADCGFTVAPGDPAAFAHAILRLRDLPAHERERLGKNGRDFVMKNHDYRILARRFLEVMSDRGATEPRRVIATEKQASMPIDAGSYGVNQS
jgi:glycosyltransferase involved in cell wall biosynthesis